MTGISETRKTNTTISYLNVGHYKIRLRNDASMVKYSHKWLPMGISIPPELFAKMKWMNFSGFNLCVFIYYMNYSLSLLLIGNDNWLN